MATYNFNDVKTGNTASWETLISYLNATLGAYDLVRLLTFGGWIASPDTWTYSTPTTFTVGRNITSEIGVGTKIWLTQTSSKFFYVTNVSYSAPNTTVTVYGGTDYTLANAAITSPYFSHFEPYNFPSQFNYTPTIAGSGTMTVTSTTITSAYFTLKKGLCTVHIDANTTLGGTATSYWTWSPPITGKSSLQGGAGLAVDPSSGTFCCPTQMISGTEVRLYRATSGNWSLGAGAYIRQNFSYFIN